jgi:quinol monooxygenase YgiN
MHHVLARITVKPEAADSARSILEELAKHTRAEEGCVSYDLYQQTETPHVFVTVEVWKDAATADHHMTTPHVSAAIGVAAELFAAPPEILAYDRLM